MVMLVVKFQGEVILVRKVRSELNTLLSECVATTSDCGDSIKADRYSFSGILG